MFERILIANRGEIACRIIETCRRLGVSTVAVHSDADAGARHVEMADIAVRIGPPPAAESYLDGRAIIEAARETGAAAIHPGYGFLSENPDFVAAVEAAGLVFIGPSETAIRAMGLKDAAKALMAEAGVPVLPGYHGAGQEDALLADQAALFGYPVLIKAVAGGGGKGMRMVEHPKHFTAALASARSEALAVFGNSRVLVEKFVTSPRHIEFQVFGDNFGNVVHLFERDCSLQRRHQKVIEEAPAPGMTPKMRAAMGAAAVRAAQTIGYSGAGTVEFIVDGAQGLHPDRFWFMEMNTRLQVEHPVTEAITGEDLVEWQLRVASGSALPKRQDEIAISGHAVEARLYAENPAAGFLPATGRLSHFEFPPGVRVDTGVRAGDGISPWYDPMIAKVISHGATRSDATAVLRRALAGACVAGSATNGVFLSRLLSHPDFLAARHDTGLIGRDLDMLTAARPPDIRDLVAAVVALCGTDLDSALAGFVLWAPLRRSLAFLLNGTGHVVDIEVLGPGRMRASGVEVEAVRATESELLIRIAGQTSRFGLAREGTRVTLFENGAAWIAEFEDPLNAGGVAEPAGDEIRTPMPGLVRRMAAETGMHVKCGDVLIVIEAMKMEHVLTAPRDGVVASADVTEGAQVSEGALLLSLEPEDG